MGLASAAASGGSEIPHTHTHTWGATLVALVRGGEWSPPGPAPPASEGAMAPAGCRRQGETRRVRPVPGALAQALEPHLVTTPLSDVVRGLARAHASGRAGCALCVRARARCPPVRAASVDVAAGVVVSGMRCADARRGASVPTQAVMRKGKRVFVRAQLDGLDTRLRCQVEHDFKWLRPRMGVASPNADAASTAHGPVRPKWC